MTKMNPLFIDSTKFHGDVITTSIELRNVVIYDDETLFVHVTNHQNMARRIQMKPLDERGYEGRIHLNHQTLISYQFVIERGGERFLHSHIHQSRAQYAVIAEWQPARGVVKLEELPPDSNSPTLTENQGRPVAGRGSASWARESSMSVRSLIEKWGL
ncbi:MAG: hypothetical protein AB7G93_09145 [Bdellovibrionales bacterium]